MLQLPQPVLSLRQARLAFAGSQALDGASLELRAGELLGLLGPNGAGKTTLIRCLAGRLSLDQGEIEFHLPAARAECLGVVPQEIAVYPDLTVQQNLRVFGRLHGLVAQQLRQRVAEALAWANLSERASALVKTLSGGMQRRLNIACSVLHHPQILLLDEPTVGVDPQSRERIYEMLDRLLEQGTAILLTTHHLEEAQTRCDRIAIMDCGRVLMSGSFEELLLRTIGTAQQISLRFTSPPASLPAPLQFTSSGLEAVGVLEDAVGALPKLLAQLREQQANIEHLTLREPTLQHMFLHLTGKELRE